MVRVFYLKAAALILDNRNEASLRRVLSDMVKNGLIMRLRDGLYTIIPYPIEPNTYFPNWHIVAHYLVGNTPYYVGYYSALTLHDLTIQPSLSEQIVVSQPMRPIFDLLKGLDFGHSQ